MNSRQSTHPGHQRDSISDANRCHAAAIFAVERTCSEIYFFAFFRPEDRRTNLPGKIETSEFTVEPLPCERLMNVNERSVSFQPRSEHRPPAFLTRRLDEASESIVAETSVKPTREVRATPWPYHGQFAEAPRCILSDGSGGQRRGEDGGKTRASTLVRTRALSALLCDYRAGG